MCLCFAGSLTLKLGTIFTASGHVWSYKATDIVKELSVIFGVPIHFNPMCLLLGFPDVHIVNAKHKRLFNLLTFAARKNILLFWIKDAAPTKESWHNNIMECIPSEHNSCLLHSTVDSCYKVWDSYLKYIGSTLSSSLLQGFPKWS